MMSFLHEAANRRQSRGIHDQVIFHFELTGQAALDLRSIHKLDRAGFNFQFGGRCAGWTQQHWAEDYREHCCLSPHGDSTFFSVVL
jgi:hypothetical protein